MFATEFPPLSHIVNWPGFGGTEGQWYEFNTIVLVYVFAILMIAAFFFFGSRKKALVPRGTQNLAEMAVDFIEEGIVMDTMGEPGKKYSPFLLSLFLFVWFTNIFGIIPVIQMPASARIALPMFLALLSYVIYHGAGIKSHGPLGYWKHALIPPGVPVFLLPLVALIEFVSKFL
ncbi:MAG: F0F1 ATP synthase subunit A, partial [Aquihabitans sp.]